jgi:hypothetical protein
VHVKKGQATQGEIYVILLFFLMHLCCFARIEMQKGEKEERKALEGRWGASFPKWRV